LQSLQANLAIPLPDTHCGRLNPITEKYSDNNVFGERFLRLDLLIEEILQCLAANLSLLGDGDGIISREDASSVFIL